MKLLSCLKQGKPTQYRDIQSKLATISDSDMGSAVSFDCTGSSIVEIIKLMYFIYVSKS
jgi:hypothetical protein